MKAFSYSTHIDRSPEVVWRYITDLTNSARWRPFVVRMETADGGAIRAGGALDVTVQVLGETKTRRTMTTVFDAPRRWATRSESGGVAGVFDYLVEADGAGSRVTFSCEMTAR